MSTIFLIVIIGGNHKISLILTKTLKTLL